MPTLMSMDLTGVPTLAAGQHLDPAAGGCFMEYASVLAGERWTDRPRCTHPALAQLARMVNDAISDESRQDLAVLIPKVIGLRGADAGLAPALVLHCLTLDPQASVAMRAPRRRAACRRARRRLDSVSTGGLPAGWCRLTDSAYRTGPARRVMARTVDSIAAESADADPRLIDLLAGGIALARRRLGAGAAIDVAPTEQVRHRSRTAIGQRVTARG